MKGKVFSSSQDLYQDQAKILFDFYKDAAEKIVSLKSKLVKQDGKHLEMIVLFVAYYINHLVNRIISKT